MTADTIRSQKKIVYSVQILRGVAAFFVVLHHVLLQLYSRGSGREFDQGAAGVDIFFVISGFVIYVAGRNLDWSEFARRRIVRIVPLYWMFLVLKIVFWKLSGGASPRPIGSLSYIVSSFLFIPAYRGDSPDPTPLITSAWTLNYEIYFYLVCSVILFAVPRRFFVIGVFLVIGLTSMGGLGLTVSTHILQIPAILSLFNPICLEFLAGIVLGILWIRSGNWPTGFGFILLCISVAWFCIAPKPGLIDFHRPLFWGIPSILLVASFLIFELKFNFRRFKFLLLLGDSSYALYLSHSAVLPILDKILTKLRIFWEVEAVILSLICILVGIVIHLFVERPMTARVSRILKLKTKTPIVESV